jgi:hypothetical protein
MVVGLKIRNSKKLDFRNSRAPRSKIAITGGSDVLLSRNRWHWTEDRQSFNLIQESLNFDFWAESYATFNAGLLQLEEKEIIKAWSFLGAKKNRV